MDTLTLILILVLALVIIAAVIVIFLLQSRSNRQRTELLQQHAAERDDLLRQHAAEKEDLLKDAESQKSELVRQYEAAKDGLQDQLAALKEEKAGVESRLKAREEYERQLEEARERERREAAEQREKERLAAAERHEKEQKAMAEQHAKELQQMREVFENLTSRNSETFKVRSAETISELLKPVQEKFQAFSEAVKESQEKTMERHNKLEQKIVDLDNRSQAVSDEARNLANALTGYSKVQGDFGEMLLTDVLKNAGLTEGVHFFTQGVMTDASGHEIKSADGRTLIPDVMVYYPDDTTVIIDSKVSLTAYNQYLLASTVEERTRLAKAHVASVRSHVDELKGKDYASYIPDGRRKVEFNIMFIPVEGAFRLMLEADPMLWQVAKDNRVLIVSQMTLIIVLNMIQMAWKQHEQEKNIADVYKTAEELMGQLKGWMDSYVKLGEHLGKAAAAYEESKKKLTDSNQSVVKKIGKLEKLGLAPKRSNAKIKTGARLSGPESVIPRELSASNITEE
ncbi:MAG: DNA recombination protein RmuC [Bacteroidales bacterium]|nr:DNA recombination protein RmuC [Bacteroidales bacterium]